VSSHRKKILSVFLAQELSMHWSKQVHTRTDFVSNGLTLPMRVSLCMSVSSLYTSITFDTCSQCVCSDPHPDGVARPRGVMPPSGATPRGRAAWGAGSTPRHGCGGRSHRREPAAGTENLPPTPSLMTEVIGTNYLVCSGLGYYVSHFFSYFGKFRFSNEKLGAWFL